MRGLGSGRRWALAIVAMLALVVMAAGTVVAGFVGSDDTFFNRPADLGADGRPVLTAPDLLAYEGVTITLRASAPGGVFIGTAHPVDVADFVGDSARIRLTSATRTGVVAEDVGSEPPVQPASADFWTHSMSGPGVEELTLTRDSWAAQWVIAPLTGEGPTTVSVGITVHGLFVAALIAAGAGAVLLLVCVEVMLRSRRRRRAPPSAGGRKAAYTESKTVAPPRPGGKHRAHRTVILTLSLAVSLTGCDVEDLLPAKRQPAELATTKVALTRAELPALLESYDARLRTAIEAARPPRYRPDKWRLADRGPALESDLFGTRVARLTQLGRRTIRAHEGIEAFSGRFDSYPMWTLAASTVGREPRLDLFTKSSVQAPWLRQAGTTLSRDLPGPGRPGPIPSGDEAAAATAAWRDYLQSGAENEQLMLDEASRTWRHNIADLGGRAMFRGYSVSVEPAGRSGLSRVVEVADGALAMVALRVTTRLDGRRDLMVRWEPPYGKYRPSEGGVLSFADIAVGVIHLPSHGTPRLLGSTFSEVAVKE